MDGQNQTHNTSAASFYFLLNVCSFFSNALGTRLSIKTFE